MIMASILTGFGVYTIFVLLLEHGSPLLFDGEYKNKLIYYNSDGAHYISPISSPGPNAVPDPNPNPNPNAIPERNLNPNLNTTPDPNPNPDPDPDLQDRLADGPDGQAGCRQASVGQGIHVQLPGKPAGVPGC